MEQKVGKINFPRLISIVAGELVLATIVIAVCFYATWPRPWKYSYATFNLALFARRLKEHMWPRK